MPFRERLRRLHGRFIEFLKSWFPHDDHPVPPAPENLENSGTTSPPVAPPDNNQARATSPPESNPGSSKQVPARSSSTNQLAAAANPEGETESWPMLRSFLRALDRSPLAFGPLKVVTSGLVDCVEIFEEEANNRKAYNKLRAELENVFEALEQFLTQADSRVMTTSMESLCASIQKELSYMQKKQGRGTVERHLEARADSDDILKCYQRIHIYIQRLSLNVNMSLWTIVDEQITDARLDRLCPSMSACYNSSQALEVKRGACTPGTRVDVLGQMHGWIHNPTTGIVYWLNGMAGTGKTTIAYTLCAELEAAYQLGASFFCSRSLPDCRDVNLIIPSIAYQLAQFSRPFRSALSRVLEKERNVHTRLIPIQFESLIVKPLLDVRETLPGGLVVVIDALDECNNQQSTGLILDALFTKASKLPIKFFVSSRPEPEIRDQMQRQGDHRASSRLVLHELDKGTVQGDIETYLRQALAQIQPTELQVATLVQRAGILFIYAATVVRFIGFNNFRQNPRSRLEEILELSAASGDNPYHDIDELYTVILNAAINNPGLRKTERDDIKRVLHTAVCAREPLTMGAMSELLGLHDVERVNIALQPLWSVLHVVETNGLVATLHASFPDFMFDPNRSGQYHCDSIRHDHTLAQGCFDCIQSTKQRFNICGLESSYVADEKIPDLNIRVERAILPELSYACRYWASHLDHAEGTEEVVERLQAFLSTRLLLWMEVMNLKKCMDEGTRAMQQAEGWCMRRRCSEELVQLMHDAWRFAAAYTSSAVSQSTPHIYVSMLPFWPETTPISRCYGKGMKAPRVPQGAAIPRRRLDLLATWPVDGKVSGLAWSPDGARLALIAGGNIFLLDGFTGRVVIGPLQKSHLAQSIAYSRDGTRIVSGSKDGTIRVWDAGSGKKVAGPLKGHKKEVSSVAFYPNGTRIVSGSNDKTLRVWDIQSEKTLLKTQAAHSGAITSLKVSPDGTLIISGSDDTTICVQDGQSGQAVLSPLIGHANSVNSVEISPDGTRIVSGSSDGTIRVWDLQNGQAVLGPLHGHTKQVMSVGFAPDGTRVVSGSQDATICVWDIQSGQMVLGPLQGHTSGVGSVSFSPEGTRIVSGSDDKTIRVWDIQSGSTTLDPIEGHSEIVSSVAFSPDGTRIVSGSWDKTIRVWDIQSGQTVLGPLEVRTSYVTSVAFSLDATRIVSGSYDGTIHVWEGQTGQMVLGPLERHTHYSVCSVGFSPDGSRIVSGSADKTILVLDLQSGQTVLGPLRGHTGGVNSVNFSPDGTRIVSGSDDKTIRVWDVQSGQTVLDPLQGHTHRVLSVGFSPDGSRIVSGSADVTVRVWDIRSGQTVLGPLQGHTNGVRSVGFSPNGTHIVSASSDNTILIWDAQSGQPALGPLNGHTGSVWSVGFSPDGTRIVSGSTDKTIWVWDVRSPQTPLSPSALSIPATWEIDSSGWVTDDQSRLLVWVPPDLRDALLPPRVVFKPLPNAFVLLNFENVRIGESWAECYQPV